MAISPQTNQYLSQLGTLRYVDVNPGPEGPQGVVAYWLIPTNGYHQGQRFPHDVKEDLDSQSFKKTVLEGVEYHLVPEVSSNTPGLLSHYAQRTGAADLQNPPGGGVNRARETFRDNSAAATIDPESVRSYVDSIDAHEEARKKASEEDQRVQRQVTLSPAREPAEGKLVHTNVSDEPEVEAPASETPSSDSSVTFDSDGE